MEAAIANNDEQAAFESLDELREGVNKSKIAKHNEGWNKATSAYALLYMRFWRSSYDIDK